MHSSRSQGKAPTAAILSLFVVLLSVTAPLLDVDLFSAGTGVESEHDPSSCVRGHDHTVCQQVITLKLAPAPTDARQPTPDEATSVRSAEATDFLGADRSVSTFPRAPPFLT